MSRRVPRADHRQAAVAAVARPGQWTTVHEYLSVLSARSVAYRIRTGRPLGSARYGSPYLPASDFEARVELTPDGAVLLVRYVARQEAS